MKINVKNGYNKYIAKTVTVEHENVAINLGWLDEQDSIELALIFLEAGAELIPYNYGKSVNKYETIIGKLNDVRSEFERLAKETNE